MADRVTVEAAAIRRLRVAALRYMARVGAQDPGLLEAVDALWESGTPARSHYGIAETAARLGVSERTVRRRLADGSLRGVRLGRRWLIPAINGQVRSGADSAGDVVGVGG